MKDNNFMVYFVSSPSSSGIPEAIDSVIGDDLKVFVVVGILIAALVSLFFVWYLVDKALKVPEDKTTLLSGVSASAAGTLVGVLGFAGFLAFASHGEDKVYETTVKSIEENFDMQDINVRNIDDYSELNKSRVYGSSDGRILEFELGYSAEHDVMMPIVATETLAELPVKEDSTLESVLNTRTDNEG